MVRWCDEGMIFSVGNISPPELLFVVSEVGAMDGM
jgi:hypothetical protein